ncbi:hypothetical protein [Streptomyces profundus]|uniref:hypothetical protein n=1 Tax=Streptomyces profundus TaxID=2867410 RepID=UPI001D1650C4|nr:hypothetical protein [Streptomyces sp. MA3_2.13]
MTLPVAVDSRPERVAFRSWADAWTEVECPACGEPGQWPQPGFDCPCGAAVRLTPLAPLIAGGVEGTAPDEKEALGELDAVDGPVVPSQRRRAAVDEPPVAKGSGPAGPLPRRRRGPARARRPAAEGGGGPAANSGSGGRIARDFAVGRRAARGSAEEETDPTAAVAARGVFRPLTIRTRYDAVACAAHFLRWLGFAGVRTTVPRTASGLDLRGPSVVGLVDTSTQPTGDEELEVLWLHGLLSSSQPVAFSLAGYRRNARDKAEGLGLPLLVLDLSGTPQPVNESAELLLHLGPDANLD